MTATYPVGALARYDRDCDRAQEALDALSKGAKALLDQAQAAGWMWSVAWSEDTGGSPFVNITLGFKADDGQVEIRACWHTRDTGTPRLFHPLLRRSRGGWRDCTLAQMRDLVAEHPGPVPQPATQAP